MSLAVRSLSRVAERASERMDVAAVVPLLEVDDLLVDSVESRGCEVVEAEWMEALLVRGVMVASELERGLKV